MGIIIMKNIFEGKKIYATKWVEDKDAVRDFESIELEMVIRAEVVPSQYGNSVKFTMKASGEIFIPVDQRSTCVVGDTVDLTKAKITMFNKPGEEPIERILIL